MIWFTIQLGISHDTKALFEDNVYFPPQTHQSLNPLSGFVPLPHLHNTFPTYCLSIPHHLDPVSTLQSQSGPQSHNTDYFIPFTAKNHPPPSTASPIKAMKKAPKKDLVVIGTARKPNASDLRNRGLSGLPDPSPEVALRRAELELEQEALRAQVALLQGENELSFLRTKIGVHRSTDDDVSGLIRG